MDIYEALAIPIRRNIIEIIATNNEVSASDISANFSVSPQAISQHLKILRDAKLVHVEKRAQKRIYTVNHAAFREMDQWVQDMTREWGERFLALDKVLEKEIHKQ